jgi:hypothetical protein
LEIRIKAGPNCPPKKGRSIILKSFQFGWREAFPEPECCPL